MHGACRDMIESHADALRGRRLLLITSDAGRPNLRGELVRVGASVTLAPAYRYIHRVVDEVASPIDLVVLPSSSAARAVLASDIGTRLRGAPMIAMGPATAAEARRHGAAHVQCAPTDTVPSLVATALATLGAS
jgi:uroporphyrinogen III methyltransferase / synthase